MAKMRGRKTFKPKNKIEASYNEGELYVKFFFYLILNLPNFLIKNKSNWWQFATEFKYGF
jgi:hypothetical protein